jgi:hypothetical protein
MRRIMAFDREAFDAELPSFFATLLEGGGHRIRGRRPHVNECEGCGTIMLFPTVQQRRCSNCRVALRAAISRAVPRNVARDGRRDAHAIEFIGIDGEGINHCDERGIIIGRDYVLLSVTGCEPLHKNGEPLTLPEIFDWLYNTVRASHPNACFVGFSIGYDLAQWMKDLPHSRAASLYTKDGIKKRRRNIEHMPPFPVYWRHDPEHSEREWELDSLGDKRLKFRPYLGPYRAHEGEKTTDANRNKLSWMYVCDTFSFFQCSFLKAIDPQSRVKAKLPPYLTTQEDYELILEGKARRADAQFDADMIRYNQAEVDVLAALMREVNEGLVQNHVRLKRPQFFGPGQVAQAFLDHTLEIPRLLSMNTAADAEAREKLLQKLPAYIADAATACHNHAYCGREYIPVTGKNVREHVPDCFRDAGRKSYYGGRFEVFYHGKFRGTCYEYDINSAYPAVMCQLPCLFHGDYLDGKGNPYDALPANRGFGVGNGKVLCCAYVTVTGSHPRMAALPWRGKDGRILFPHIVKGWYWLHEIEAAQRAKLIDRVDWHEWVAYIPCDCPPPLGWIETLYQERAAMGEGKNAPSGVGKKLGYNSIYGKFAQSVGNPKYGNAVYASLITAGCRCIVLDAIASHPAGAYGVLNIATDGVYFGSRHLSLEIDKTKLGAFDETPRSNMTFYKPGCYWDDNARELVKQYLYREAFDNMQWGGTRIWQSECAKGAIDRSLDGLKMKARSVNLKTLAEHIFEIDRLFARMKPYDPWPVLMIPITFSVISPRTALMRRKWSEAGRVQNDREMKYGSDPAEKRQATGRGFSAPWTYAPDVEALRLFGMEPTPEDTETTYYDQRFGEDTFVREDMVFPDGKLNDQLEGVLFGKAENFYERAI